jgi:crossover junction endodeoxyribonuclease RuvC
MRVLGIDPGLARTGYACLLLDEQDPSSPPTVQEAGILRLKDTASVPSRLAELERDLLALIDRARPACVCVESLFAHYAHPRTAIIMGHARGVILLVAARAGLRVLELPPAEVKKSVAGNGRATKEQVQQAVAVLLSLPSLPEPADVADAIAIAMCGGRRLHNPLDTRVIEPGNGRRRVRSRPTAASLGVRP